MKPVAAAIVPPSCTCTVTMLFAAALVCAEDVSIKDLTGAVLSVRCADM
jgi:hypothetical protein